MIHLLDKMNSGQLVILFVTLAIIAGVTIASVFRSLAHMFRGWPEPVAKAKSEDNEPVTYRKPVIETRIEDGRTVSQG